MMVLPRFGIRRILRSNVRSLLSLPAALTFLALLSPAWGEEPIVSLSEVQVREVFHLVQQSQREVDAGRLHGALELLERARDIQPGNAAVDAQIRRVERLLGHHDGEEQDPQATVGREAEEALARAELRVMIRRIELLITEGDFERAESNLTVARAHLEGQSWARDTEQIQRLERLLAEVRAQQATSAEERARALRQVRQDQAQEALMVRDAEQRSVISTRLERIITIQQRGHYELALAHARQLLSQYPQAGAVQALYERLLEQVYTAREMSIEEQKRFVYDEIFDRIHRSLIPDGFDGRPVFPADWEERNQRTPPSLAGDAVIPAWHDALNQRLGQRLNVEFRDIDAVEVLEFIAQRAGINLVISSEVRMGANPPISLVVSNMRADSILTWVCRQMDTAWRLHSEAVFVGGTELEAAVLRIYDLTEATFAVPDLPGPEVSGMQLGGTGGGGGGGVGGGFDLFGGAGGGFGQEDVGIGADDVLDLIREAVDPQACENPEYTMDVRSGNSLLVNAPPRMHILIQEFLRSQMGLNRTMVRTEMRWLEVYDGYLEEIGINWGGDGDNLLVTDGLEGSGGRRNYRTASAAARVINNLPETAMAIAPAVATGGLNLHIVRLGTTQLQGMFTAIERTQRGRRISAIDLTSMHGQRAHALFVRQVAYISDYEADGDLLNPVLSTVSVGDVLDIQPYVSADRKYVTMDVRPVQSTVSLVTEFISVLRPFDNGVVIVQDYPIELPNLHINTAGTRVMIPDGGSIMVGGFTSALQQNAQANVPVLGHVPFLGRLFGKRGRYSQNSQIFLTVTVDIILYDEEEALL